MLSFSDSLKPIATRNAASVRALLAAPEHRHLCICGPVGSAKTYLILMWIHAICSTQPNVRVAICRKERVTLYTTLVESLRKILKYGLQNADALHYTVRGGERRPESLHYLTGSSITFLGYDSSKLFGSEWSIVLTNESRLVEEDAYAEVAARLRGGGFWDRHGRETYLMLSDTNASAPHLWIKQWEADGRLQMVNMVIEDNPYYADAGELNARGKAYLDDLRNNFTGWAFERYVNNVWCEAEGAVYSGIFNEAEHVVAKEIADAWYSVSIDHSHSGTIALVLWENSQDNRETHALKCFYTTEKTVDELFAEFEGMLGILGVNKEDIRVIVADTDPSKNALILQRGYRAVENATKRVVGGIEVVKSWLAAGRITFNPNLLAHAPDSRLKYKGKCFEPLQEFTRYVYPIPCLDDKPVKGHDDFLDAVRYHIEHLSEKPQYAAPIIIGGSSPMKSALPSYLQREVNHVR